MKKQINIPVVLIGFNRPEAIKEVFNCIKAAKPKKFYVSIDGPRHNTPGEDQLVENVKKIVQQVNWECETHYKYNDVNLGAEVTVSEAVTWTLENEECVIVLEDDMVAPLSFFWFAEEMLIKYKDDHRIITVSGSNFTPTVLPDNTDYFFSKYGNSWGWATWKRSWEKFNLYVNDFDKYLYGTAINSLVNSHSEKRFWRRRIKSMKKKGAGNNTWDFCWAYIRFKEQGLTVIPKNNLISNIGIFGLHARGQRVHHYRPVDNNYVVVNHPKKVERNIDYDVYHFRKYLNKKTPIYKRIIRKALRILKMK